MPEAPVCTALRAFLHSPLAGMSPWVLMAVLSAPGRFELSVGAALALAVFGLVASSGARRWLELWSGELSNVALLLFVGLTLAIRRPFTLAYAREVTDPAHWSTPLFLSINQRISAVWALAFAFSALCGLYGDAVLRNPDAFWSGWVLQIAATAFAVAFTEFWPGYPTARARGETPPSRLALVEWVPGFALVTGIVGLLTQAVPPVLGGLLVGGGAIAERWLLRRRPCA